MLTIPGVLLLLTLWSQHLVVAQRHIDGTLSSNRGVMRSNSGGKNSGTGVPPQSPVQQGPGHPPSSGPFCQVVEIPLCKNIWYNMTRMPNMFNHETQEEAGMEAHQFWPLVTINCSPDLRFFLCSLYAPICIENYQHSLPPCRSMCERANQGCAPIMRQYGFSWPERMKCDQFPVYGNPEGMLCMERNETKSNDHEGGGGSSEQPREKPDSGGTPPQEVPSKPRTEGETTSQQPHGPSTAQNLAPWTEKIIIMTVSPVKVPDAASVEFMQRGVWNWLSMSQRDMGKISCRCQCQEPLLRIPEENKTYFDKFSTGGMASCAEPCYSPYFDKKDRTFATFWLGTWACLCLACTLVTVTTFLVDMERFYYPERPIIFLSVCYLFLSVGYLVRVGVGHDALACSGLKFGQNPLEMVRYGGSGPALCALVFLLIYFFGMASSVWWLVLTITWFLAAGLKWGSEAIAQYADVYHILAWVLPGVQTILALTMSAVDGDSVTGICYVGNTNPTFLKLFVLGPLVVYLTLGTFFLLAGFVALFRIRSAIKLQTGQKTDKLEKLMIRIGIFGFLYTVPAAVVISCLFYELHQRDTWSVGLSCNCRDGRDQEIPELKPEYAMYMLKHFMYLVVGITSGFWIWSNKTLHSWHKFLFRLGCLRTTPKTYQEHLLMTGGHCARALEVGPGRFSLGASGGAGALSLLPSNQNLYRAGEFMSGHPHSQPQLPQSTPQIQHLPPGHGLVCGSMTPLQSSMNHFSTMNNHTEKDHLIPTGPSYPQHMSLPPTPGPLMMGSTQSSQHHPFLLPAVPSSHHPQHGNQQQHDLSAMGTPALPPHYYSLSPSGPQTGAPGGQQQQPSYSSPSSNSHF